MKDVIDIIIKNDRALIILSRKDRSVIDSIRGQIEKEFNIRKTNFLEPDLLFKERTLIKDFFDGFSVVNKMNLCEEFGLKKFISYTYALENLQSSKKVQFSYDLVGRRGQPGILQRGEGFCLGKGAVAIPEEFKSQIEEIFKKWKVDFKKEIFYR